MSVKIYLAIYILVQVSVLVNKIFKMGGFL
nr:MAG TPA: hypothetical protein [Caudoviricetes sp.]